MADIKPQEKKRMRHNKNGDDEKSPNCPRCDSGNTKFCYYNNYNLSQPRYLCKSCRRYWTKGGVLRNIPVGGGCRQRNKGPPSSARRSQSGGVTISLPHPPPLLPPYDMLPAITPTGFIENYAGLVGGGFLHAPANQPPPCYGNLENSENNPYENGTAKPRDDQEDHRRVDWGFPWHLLGGDNSEGNIMASTTTINEEEEEEDNGLFGLN